MASYPLTCRLQTYKNYNFAKEFELSSIFYKKYINNPNFDNEEILRQNILDFQKDKLILIEFFRNDILYGYIFGYLDDYFITDKNFTNERNNCLHIKEWCWRNSLNTGIETIDKILPKIEIITFLVNNSLDITNILECKNFINSESIKFPEVYDKEKYSCYIYFKHYKN